MAASRSSVTDLTLDTVTQLAPVTADSDITHEICCLDEDKETGCITMCGLALPDEDDSALSDSVDPTCAVCFELVERWAEYGDLYGDDVREPITEPCRVCPRREKPIEDPW